MDTTIEEEEQQPKLSGLPALEQERLKYNLRGGVHGTTLTAQELYVLEQGGFEVLNVVIGNIVYSMGLRGLLKSFRRAITRGEMVDFTRMNLNARELARNRMLQEAATIGADTVIDIIFETHEYADFIEVTAIGTAVRRVREARGMPVVVSN